MTTSSKTNMNEELKKEFEEAFYDAFAGTGAEDWVDDEMCNSLWSWIETAITKAKKASYMRGYHAKRKDEWRGENSPNYKLFTQDK